MLKRREQAICPCCGQRVLMRHGVQLSPLLADLFDMIERAGKEGLYSEVLAGVFYPDKPLKDGRNCVKSNVAHLNARLASTDIEIRSGSSNDPKPFRVIKRK
jgi:hypothetical protein